jgi:hypothetical protein
MARPGDGQHAPSLLTLGPHDKEDVGARTHARRAETAPKAGRRVMPNGARCQTARNAEERVMPNGAGRERRTTWGVPGPFRKKIRTRGAGHLTPKVVLRVLCVLRGPIALGPRDETTPGRDGTVQPDSDPECRVIRRAASGVWRGCRPPRDACPSATAGCAETAPPHPTCAAATPESPRSPARTRAPASRA